MAPVRGLWLAWALLGVAGACPEPCACVDKYAHQFVDCAYKELREVPEGLPANVTTLSLSANKIAVLRQGAFANVTQVTSLWLAHSEVRTVEPGALAVLSQLKNLDLSHNLISSFPWSDLRNLSALQLLKMNHNRVGSLPRDALAALPDLRSLRINNNRLRTLEPGTFDGLGALSHLQLYHNPFHCGCGLVWLQAWAASTRVSLPELDSIACASPPELHGVPVHRLPALACAPPSVRLRAEPAPPAPPGAPLRPGSALLLHCAAEGHPAPRLQWRLQIPGGSVTLEPPGPSGEGTGDAAPIGEEGEEGDEPTQTQPPTPTPAPAWPAPPAAPRFVALANGSLWVPAVSAKEAGVYTCRAHNELGSNSTAVRVAVAAAGPPKHAAGEGGPAGGQAPTSERKAGGQGRDNSVLPAKPEGKGKGQGRAGPAELPEGAEEEEGGEEGGEEEEGEAGPGEEREGAREQHCGRGDPTRYVSNHAFNQSAELKPHAFELGVIALDVAEREARVQLTPLAARWGPGPGGSPGASARPGRRPPRLLYLCPAGGGAAVQWSRVEDGVNAYWFRGLRPGTNYSVCLALAGEPCHVRVVFATKKELPSLLVIVTVGAFLLALATVPLLGAACCHLLAKHPAKPYRLILRPQPPDPMQKRIAADFDPRASYLESERSYPGGRGGGGGCAAGEGPGGEPGEEPPDGPEEDDADPRGDPQAACSLEGSPSKAHPEEFEAGSEYSDRLPLGAEAVSLSPEINGNYRHTAG
ncbi:immunoglobulin superfamily containing leucine-rich repeat protein 2 [Thomomys bottae]